MNDEAGLWRPAPPSPYVLSGKVLTVPAATLTLTVAVLRSAGHVEAACLWLGTLEDNGSARVEALVVQAQINRPRNYMVPGQAMVQVAQLARPHGWTVVGAIHSHPGLNVEHSTYDDEMTPSRKAVSLVVPQYGHWTGPWPRGLGVHEYFEKYWHLLTDEQARKRVHLSDAAQVPAFDLR